MSLIEEIQYKIRELEEAGFTPKSITINPEGMNSLINDFKNVIRKTCFIEVTNYGIPKTYHGLPISLESYLSTKFVIGV